MVKRLLLLCAAFSCMGAFADTPDDCIKPESPYANKEVIQFAQCLKKNHRYLYAIDYLESIADVAPAANVYGLLGEIRFYNNEVQAALEASERSLTIKPDYMPAKYWLANSMFRRAMEVSPTHLQGLQIFQPDGCKPSEHEMSQQDEALEKQYYSRARELFLEMAEKLIDDPKAWAGVSHMAAASLIGLGDMEGGIRESEYVARRLATEYQITGEEKFTNFAASIYATMANQASVSDQPKQAEQFAQLAEEHAADDMTRAEVAFVNSGLNAPASERNLPCEPIIIQE